MYYQNTTVSRSPWQQVETHCPFSPDEFTHAKAPYGRVRQTEFRRTPCKPLCHKQLCHHGLRCWASRRTTNDGFAGASKYPAVELQLAYPVYYPEDSLLNSMGNVAQLSLAQAGTDSPFLKKVGGWKTLVLGLLIAWLYLPVLVPLVRQWWIDPNFSHGFFVPVFAGYVAWQNRARLAGIPSAPSFWGLPVILLALVLLILGVFGAELFLSRVSLIVLIGGMLIFFQGWRTLRAVLFPLLFLILMIPIPAILLNQITFPLQILASKLAAWSLPLCGVPVLREGNIINLPAMPLEVAQACSGIRSLLSLATLAVMYGYLLEKSVLVRVVLALASVPVAVAANGFRIFGTGLLVQYWDPEKAEGFFHQFSGWLIFVVSLLLLFGVHWCIKSFLAWKESRR
jgi:exosortase